MNVRIPLSGDDWLFNAFPDVGEGWRGTLALDKRQGWHRGRALGSVLDDLMRAGTVAGPLFEENSVQVDWVPQRTWVSRTSVALPAEHIR